MSRARGPKTARRGFTLVEVVIALGLVALVGANIFMAMDSSTKAYQAGVSRSDIEFQADQTLDRIALAVLGSAKDSLYSPNEFPSSHSQLYYQRSLGFIDGAAVLGDTEYIGHVQESNQVLWREKPGSPGERQVVWTNWARDLLKDELLNGVDDNGNGLTDEKGLAFSIEGELVTIRLTLERPGADGATLEYYVETQVACRN